MAPLPVVTGATLTCSFGVAPSTLVALPTPRVMVEGRPVAVLTDAVPMANIPPFGMCMSLGNPTVAALTAAALGVLTPAPCVPATAAWINPAATTTAGALPVVTQGSTCMCAFGGVIQVANPGAMRTQVG